MADPISATVLASAATAGGTAAAAGAAGTVGAALTANTVAAMTAAVGAGSSMGFGTLLSLGMTGIGALGSISGGMQQSAMYKQQAEQAGINAQLEGLKGRQEALAIKKQRDQNLASINATYAARGGYVGSGTPAQAIIESRRNATNDINTAQFNSSMTQSQLRAQSSNYKQEASSARTGGITNAITGIVSSRSVQSLLDI